jgi:hypothetical protein
MENSLVFEAIFLIGEILFFNIKTIIVYEKHEKTLTIRDSFATILLVFIVNALITDIKNAITMTIFFLCSYISIIYMASSLNKENKKINTNFCISKVSFFISIS